MAQDRTPGAGVERARPLRVVHVMESTIGGTRRHLRDLAGGQARAGLEVHVVASAERQPAVRGDLRALEALGCGVYELPMARAIRPLLDARHVAAVARLLRRVRPDVVHTHSSKGGVIGRLASLSTGVGRRVHTPHTFAFLFREMFGPAKRRLFFEVERALARTTARVVAVSESEAETFRRSGVVDPARVAVVPNGIDPGPFQDAAPLPREALGLDPARPLVGVVGLLNAAKGQDLALEALAAPGCEAAELLLVGHGELRGALEARAAALGLERRVHFLGFRDDVPALLATLDLLLLPSRWEGMPYVVLEAFAAGRPVLATPVDGAVELVRPGETGWLAEEASGPALGRALAAALAASPAERAALGARGRARVAERYSAAAMVARTVELYRSLS